MREGKPSPKIFFQGLQHFDVGVGGHALHAAPIARKTHLGEAGGARLALGIEHYDAEIHELVL